MTGKKGGFSFLITIWCITLAISVTMAQPSNPLKKVKQAFVSFEYQRVIRLADSLMENPELLDTLQTIELLRMKAISHYSLNQQEMATLCFVRILQLNEKYQLDPLINSPKIIAFFETIKKDFLKSRKPPAKLSTTFAPVKKNPDFSEIRKPLLHSMLLPGWGHLNMGRGKKGFALLGLSGITLSASIYYAIKTRQLEKDYLNSIEQKEIDKRYQEFNQAFKIRNALLIGYALLWGYAQYDLLNWKGKNFKLILQPSLNPETKTLYGFQLQF